MSSLKPIGNIVVICCAFFIIFGILGVQVCGAEGSCWGKPEEWPSYWSRMLRLELLLLTLFQEEINRGTSLWP